MSDKKISVELTEDEARELARFALDEDENQTWKPLIEDAGKKIRAALPPEPPEGTVAWLHFPDTVDGKGLAVRVGGQWAGAVWPNGNGYSHWDDEGATVEPLRVLGADEFAVPRPNRNDISSLHVRDVANRVDDFRPYTAQWLRRVADALEAAEADS